jgi:DNA-binding MarR family transcriptional regulator
MGEHLSRQDIHASRDSLLREIGDESRMLQNEWDRVDDAVAQMLGVNRTDLRVMDILERVGPVTAGRLAELSSLSTGAVTALIDRLEGAGYVRRDRDPADRRRVIVDVDRERMRDCGWVYEWVVDESVRRMAGMSDDQLRVVLDFLRMGRQLSADHADWVREQIASRGQTGH